MKRIFLTLFLLLNSIALATDKIHVMALSDFNSNEPSEKIIVQVIEETFLSDLPLKIGDKITCNLTKTKEAKRGKRNAKAYFNIEEIKRGQYNLVLKKTYEAKYAHKVMNKEAIKEIEPKNAIKKTIGTVGNFFVQGISLGVSFVDGVATNKEDNRLKSGVKQVYDDSILSYIEEGDIIDVHTGDFFYLIVKEEKEYEIDEDIDNEIE